MSRGYSLRKMQLSLLLLATAFLLLLPLSGAEASYKDKIENGAREYLRSYSIPVISVEWKNEPGTKKWFSYDKALFIKMGEAGLGFNQLVRHMEGVWYHTTFRCGVGDGAFTGNIYFKAEDHESTHMLETKEDFIGRFYPYDMEFLLDHVKSRKW
jgi:hypothetical protein